ncbi:MAG: hypothetical protein U0441_29280 [Polyangiaceae bacterium]
MPLTLHERQAFIRRCDPNEPLAAGDPAYVPLDQGASVRGSDGLSCIDELERTILFSDPAHPTCQLFTGFAGAGKTTELRILRERLGANKDVSTHAVMIDFESYIDVFRPISITDVLRVLAYVLDREATIEENGDPDKRPGYAKRLFDFITRTDLQIKEIGFEEYGASFMLELKNNPTFHKRAEEALSLRFQQFAKEANEAMAAAVVRLRKATGAQRVVVIADGLEKLTPVTETERKSVEASVETVFVQHASWLRLPCDAIYTYPLWLRFRTAVLGPLYDQEPPTLPMVRIAEPGGAPYPAGVAKLVDLVSRRVEVRRVFAEPLDGTLGEIIRASGGYPRDLLRMVRDVLMQSSSFPAPPEVCRRTIDKLAEAYSRIIREPDVALLIDVARTHSLPHGDDERMNAFGALLGKWLILTYRNGHEWYDLHPLVRRVPAVWQSLSKTP